MNRIAARHGRRAVRGRLSRWCELMGGDANRCQLLSCVQLTAHIVHSAMFRCLCQLVIELYRYTVLCSNVCIKCSSDCTYASNCTDAQYRVPVFVSVGYVTVQMQSIPCSGIGESEGAD